MPSWLHELMHGLDAVGDLLKLPVDLGESALSWSWDPLTQDASSFSKNFQQAAGATVSSPDAYRSENPIMPV